MLLENATGIINAYLQRVLELSSYSESFDPIGSSVFVKQWPIDETANAVTVTENGTALVKGTSFVIVEATGEIIRTTTSSRRRDWVTGGGLQSLTVTYDAGYDMTTDPLILPEAVIGRDVCTRIVARVFQAAAAYANAPTSAAGIKTLTIEGSDSVTYSDTVSGMGGVTAAAPQLTDEDKMALAPLMRKVLVNG
jgi:hypothetical protein